MRAIDIRNLTIERDKTILSNITWTVEEGQHSVILGPNGSGKSSLLNAMLSYLMPTRGEMHILGKQYGRSIWPELRKQIGVVGPAVKDMIKGRELAEKMVASGKDAVINSWGQYDEAEQKRAEDLLGQFGISRLIGQRWETLSQGERQKVLLCRAMMSGHRLLFLDEPCAGLDPYAREEFLAFVERVKETAETTLILITHHVEEILPFFDNILMLRSGRLLAAGSRDEILTSSLLSDLFGGQCELHRLGDRLQLQVSLAKNTC